MAETVEVSGVEQLANRGRIVSLVFMSALVYVVAMIIAGAVAGLMLLFGLLFEGGVLPDTAFGWKLLGLAVVAVVVLGGVFGFGSAAVRLPLLRRRLEERVIGETNAQFGFPDDFRQLQNVLDGLAIAAGIPAPRFAVVTDPAPNSFGVGTKPEHTVIGVTTGLLDTLTRPQLEAVIAYEITRVANLDVALATWAAALTGAAGEAVDGDSGPRFIARAVRNTARRIQARTLRDVAAERDERAIAMSKNPVALVEALEALARDPRHVATISAVTAPLWIEVPNSLVAGLGPTEAASLRPLLLSERIDRLRALAHLPPAPREPPATTSAAEGAE